MPSFDQLGQLQDMAPAAMTVVWAVMLGVGGVLWLSGKRLARPACAVSGLMLGGLAGLTLGQWLAEEGAMTLPLMIGTAIVGAILAAFMFRVWMALSGALLLAVVVPAASMVWLGTAPLPREIVVADVSTETESGGAITFEDVADAITGDTAGDASGDTSGDTSGGGVWAKARGAARSVYEKQAELLEAWWDELGGGGRTFIIISALVGAGVGLLLGLILPNASAALQSSAIGAVLIFFAGRSLLFSYLPDQTAWLPTTPRQVLLVLGLITIAGLLIQWVLFRRRVASR